MRAVFRKVSGRRVLPTAKFATRLFLRIANPESARQFRWNNESGWHFDLAPLRRRHPGMVSLEQFLTRYYANKNNNLDQRG